MSEYVKRQTDLFINLPLSFVSYSLQTKKYGIENGKDWILTDGGKIYSNE